jgi:hypothetical protein
MASAARHAHHTHEAARVRTRAAGRATRDGRNQHNTAPHGSIFNLLRTHHLRTRRDARDQHTKTTTCTTRTHTTTATILNDSQARL